MKKHIKDYFIPHEGNEYKPQSLRKTALAGMMALVLLSFTVANMQSFLLVTSNWMVSAVLPAVIVDMINVERGDGSLVQLTRNSALDAAAQAKADDMAKYSYFAHFSPTGVSPWFFFNQAQYNFVNAGENLAVHFTDTTQLIDAWIASPTHRANIMNGAYTETGIGIAEGEFEGFKTLYVVQFFGTPAAQPVVVTPAPVPAPIAVAQASTIENTVDVQPVVITESEDSPVEVEVAGTNTQEVLAETAQISENTELIEADPVPVVAENIVFDKKESDTIITEEEFTVGTNTQKVLVSDFMATTTGAVPATIDSAGVENSNASPYIYELLTQPTVMLKIAYVTIGLLVFISLLLSTLIEIRRQHPVQIAYSLALLLLMFGLFKIQLIINAGVTII